MAQYTKSQLVSASNATYFTNTSGGISASAVRDLNDSWISSSALLSGSNTFIGNQIISGTLTAQLPANYIWLGDSNGYNQAVATSSISLQGAQGIQGIQGTQGTQGIQGIQGLQGLQGLQGIQGLQGTQGIQGIQGLQGIQGIEGASGSQGIQGTQGIQGITGLSGSNGTQGAQGIQGVQGTQGDSVSSGSLLVTASFDTTTRDITFTKGDATTFKLGAFATTGSNTFNAQQNITTAGNTNLNIISTGGGQANLEFQAPNANFAAYGDFNITNNGQYGGSGSIKVITKDNQMVLAASQGFQMGVVNAGGNGIEGGNITINVPSGSQQLQLTGSLNVSNTLTASLQQGYAWVGNSSNVSTLVATSSFGTSIDTGSFATTGSNTFNGDQTVNGKLTISSSANSYLQFTSPNNQTGSGQIFFGSLGPYIQTYSDSLPDNQGLQLVAGISGSFALATRYGGQNAKIDLDAMADQTNPAGARGRLQVKSNGQIELTGLGGAINLSGSGTIIQGLTYPGTDGTNGQVITTNGSGVLSFTSVSGSSINTGSFATTGSNTFTGVNTFNERTNLQGINVYTGSASGIYIGDRTTFAPTSAGNIPGNQHTIVGQGALNSFGNGDLNAAFGPNALSLLVSGSSNLAMGGFAGLALVNGNTNTFIGDQAGNGMKGGDNNFFLGSSAGNNFRTGSYNIMIGLNTQGNLATGSGNLFIGNQNVQTKIANNVDNQFAISYGTDLTPTKLFFKSGSESSNLELYGGLEIQNTLTASLTQGYAWVGNSSNRTTLVATSSFGGGTAFSNPNLVSNSGSLFIIGNTFNSASSNFSHISASTQTLSNIVFKNTNNTGTIIVSGSGNIFTNPSTPNTGYIKYIGGSNNIFLANNQGAVNCDITASATSVSGARPVMNNNIFQGTSTLTINQAVNGGTHNYNNNLFGGASNMTINALAYTGSSFTVSDNIFKGGTVTINPASASLAEIAAGISGSATFELTRNIVGGLGTMTINIGPKASPGGANGFNGNIMFGSLNITNISSSTAVNASSNIGNGTMAYSNAGAAGLALHRSAGSMSSNYGSMNLIASASAIAAANNIASGTSIQITNQTWSGSIGSGSLAINRCIFQGQSHTIIATGSQDAGTTSNANMSDNTILGRGNTIYLNQTGQGAYNAFNGNVVGGQNLIVSASNSFILSEGGGAHFGRYNANDGIRNKTGENIFSVGTGVSGSRKTGFLIDSGSNTYVEGTLNVSGSTAMTGSLSVKGNTTMSGTLSVSGTVKAWGDGYDFEYGTYTADFLGGAFNLTPNKSISSLEMGANERSQIEMYANGGNYDTFKVTVDSGSNGTQFQDFPDATAYETWMKVATSTTGNFGEITLYRNTNVTGSLDVSGSLLVSSFTTLASVSSSLNFADDTAAAAGGVPLGGLYRNGNFVMIRLT